MNTSLENLDFSDLIAPIATDQTSENKPSLARPRLADHSADENSSDHGLSCINTGEMTVFLIDDDPAVRDALSLLLKQSNLRVESFGSAKAFLDICHTEMQGCAIIDFNMPQMNGIQLQEELSERGIPLPIVFLTGTGDIPLSVKAMKAGASDFLTKPVTLEKLLSSIQTALLESEKLQFRRKTNQQCQAILAVLTRRECDVMRLALEGQTSKKIANSLGISHRTVEIHKARLMKKTGATNILDLARIVHDAGVATEPSVTPENGLQNKIQNGRAPMLVSHG